jgi:hypothetical protein
MKKMCAKCGGSMKNGGPVTKIKKKVLTMAKGGTMYGIPQENLGTSGLSVSEKRLCIKKVVWLEKRKLAALAAPKDKVTRADVIAGALKNKRKKK